MPGAPMSILGLGASTPIGRTAWASAAAARAGVCGFREHPYMVDTAGEPMRIAGAPWLDIGLEGAARMAALLLPAIDEALTPLPAPEADTALRIGLALALPPPRPGRGADLAVELLAAIGAQWPRRFARKAHFESGHAAGYLP